MADQLALTYAALILNDCGSEVSAAKLNAVVAAAGVTVRPTLPVLYARLLQKKSLASLITASQAAPAAASAAPAAAAGAAAPAAAAKDDKKGKKEEKKEEEDEEMGFGLFD